MQNDKSQKPKIVADPAQLERAAQQTQENQPKSSGQSDDQLRGDNQVKPVPGTEG